MKLKFRADPEDMMIFVIFAIFLLYIVCLVVANVHMFAVEGHLSGLNPFPAFAPETFLATIVFYLVSLLGLFISVSSMFFENEEGIGFSITKKDKGYSRWAKEREIKEELVCVPILQKTAKAAGIPIILNEKEMWVDNGEYHSLVIGATGSGKTQCLILPMVHSLAKAKESMIITEDIAHIFCLIFSNNCSLVSPNTWHVVLPIPALALFRFSSLQIMGWNVILTHLFIVVLIYML